jgi:hypothetical protein
MRRLFRSLNLRESGHPDVCLLSNEEQLLNVSQVSPQRTRTRDLDEACAAAVDLARSAAEEDAGPGRVGDYLGATAEAERVVTHLFACLDPAYAGWQWAVTVARASRSKTVTVSECVLLPGPGALLAPDWVPWRDRVRPGDLGVGDLLPAQEDDERLVPAVVLEGDDGVVDWDAAPWRAWEAWGSPADWSTGEPRLEQALAGVGELVEIHADDGESGPPEAEPPAGASPAGEVARYDVAPTVRRSRVLSAIGRDEAALRWYTGDHGPRSPLAHAAPGPCMTCGFLVRLGDPLGRVFGVCANEYAPDDGRVVSLDHGCGAHSEALIPAGAREAASPVIDELGYDLAGTPGTSVDETVFESLDHG